MWLIVGRQIGDFGLGAPRSDVLDIPQSLRSTFGIIALVNTVQVE